MNRAVLTGMVLCAGIVSVLATASAQTNVNYQQATILSVDKQELDSPPNNGGRKVTDAPLHSTYFSYEVSVRVNCGTYVGRYESAYDYLPSAFAADQQLPVRVTKHDMFFDLPGDRQFKMPITRKKMLSKTDCEASPKS